MTSGSATGSERSDTTRSPSSRWRMFGRARSRWEVECPPTPHQAQGHRDESVMASRRRWGWRMVVRDGLFVAALTIIAARLGWAWLDSAYAVDARAYYEAARGPMYANTVVGTPLAYLYSPAFAQLLAPAALLAWPAFLGLWYVLMAGTLAWLTRGWLVLAVALVFPVENLMRGNIEVVIALAIIAGFRWPTAWAFVILTKVTPGVGLLWFAVRREWRQLAVALGATAVIAAVSFILAPDLWLEWIADLRANAGVSPVWSLFPIPLPVRIALASALVAWGGLTDRRWTVPVAATLAMPLLWPVNLVVLAAVPRTLR